MTALVAPLAGAVIGLGAFVVLLGMRGSAAAPSPPRWQRIPADRPILRAASGTGTAVIIGLVTGWPVAAVVSATAAALAPSLMGGRAARQASLARLEAIAGWAEQLRDVMAAAAGIQEAIGASAAVAPIAIRPQVATLAANLEREPLRDALRRFAEQLAHPLADTVVVALVLAAERQGRLAEVLTEVARTARQTATMRLRVEAIRTRTYVTARLIVFITVAMAGGLIVFRREYLAPFDTVAGQLMLTVIGLVFLVAAVLLAHLGRPADPPRLLADVARPRW